MDLAELSGLSQDDRFPITAKVATVAVALSSIVAGLTLASPVVTLQEALHIPVGPGTLYIAPLGTTEVTAASGAWADAPASRVTVRLHPGGAASALSAFVRGTPRTSANR